MPCSYDQAVAGPFPQSRFSKLPSRELFYVRGRMGPHYVCGVEERNLLDPELISSGSAEPRGWGLTRPTSILAPCHGDFGSLMRERKP